MFRKILLTILPLAGIILLSADQMSDNGKAGRTGSPGESTCTSCHGDYTLNSGGGSVALQAPGMPAFQYTPGQTYTMSVTVSRSANSLFGIGLEALTAANDNAGTLTITDAASTQIKTVTVSSVSRRNLVHTLNGGTSSASKVFNFSWTAPSAGTGNVTFYYAGVAANNDGNEAGDYVYSGSQVFTELACQPPAQPGSISGNSSVCQGASVSYSIATVSGATTYSWTLPSGWTGSSTGTSINAVAGSSSGNISVTANSSCGSSTPQTLAATVSNLSVNANATNVTCYGLANGTATAVVSGGTGPFAYAWSPSGGTSSVATSLAPGSYTVTTTDNAGCTAAKSVTISQPAVLVASAGNNDTVCAGSGIVLGGTPVASGGTATYTYLWDHAADLSSAVAAKPTATPSTSTTYNLIVTDANGCTANSSVNINVRNVPVQPGNISGDTSVCSGSSNTYSITPVVGANSYMWTIPSGWSGNSSSASINIHADTSSGMLSVVAVNTCGNSLARTLSLNTSNVSLLVSSVDLTCNGANDGSASVTVTGGIGALSYSWSPSGDTTASINALSPGIHVVTVNDNSSCTYTDTVFILEPSLVIASAGINLAFCEGESAIIGGNPSASGGTGAWTYAWDPSTDLSSASDPNPTASPVSGQVYNLLVTDANGCSATSSVSVDVYPLPQPLIILSGDTLFCSVNAQSYEWYVNGNLISGSVDSYCVPLVVGDYEVHVSDTNSCTGVSPAYYYNSVGLEQLENTGEILFYPNPANTELNLDLRSYQKGASLTILNVAGQLVLKTVLKNEHVKLDVSGFTDGLYMGILEGNGQRNTFRFKVSHR